MSDRRRPSSIERHGGVDANRLEAALHLSASPHLKAPASTERIMWSVVVSLAPVVGAAAWYFGISALLVILASLAGAMATERVLGPGGPLRTSSLRDGSAAITGLLLGLTLPSGFPLWMAFLGGAVAIGFGKLLFGGLGQNPFNPALLGRAFLQAAFPIAITTWPAPTPFGSVGWARPDASNLALPLMTPRLDGVTEATPLGLMKFEGQSTEAMSLLLGSTGGSLGETAAFLVLAGGLWLAWKRYLDWRIPVAVLGTVAALSTLIHAIDAELPGPGFMLLSGGLMLGAWYMATDLVTSPITARGRWIFGAGIGALVVLIRLWGGLPEGVMYAILLMNALVPFIDRVTQPRVFGSRLPASGVRSPVSGTSGSASAKLIGTLAGAGAIAGLLLVSVYGWAQPRIAAHQEAALDAAVREVLGEPARYETLYVAGDDIVATPPADGASGERVFLGYDENDERVGWAIVGAKPGFQDVIRLIFGYDAASNTLLGMRVLESKETPGLGDKIEKDSAFVAGFAEAHAPIAGVKAGAGQGTPEEVDMITGATISSRAIIDIINERVTTLDPLLDAYAGAQP